MRTRDFSVMGLQLRLETDSEDVMAVAESSFGKWDSILQMPDVMEDTRIVMRVNVLPDDRDAPRTDFDYTIDGPHFRIRSGDSIGVTDADARTIHATVQRSFVRDTDHFRYGFLESLALYAVSRYDRQPFHAAAVARGGVALLLAGPPEVGKSTLAYACMRAGMRVMADDHVNIQVNPRLRIWGMSSFMHLRPEANAHFDGLPGTRTLRANGANKLAVAVPHENASPPFVDRAGLCLLSRGTGAGGIQHLDADEAVAIVLDSLESGFDHYADTIGAPLRTIANTGSWKLVLGGRPQDAIPDIERLLAQLSGVSPSL